MRQATDSLEVVAGPAGIRGGTVIGGRFRIDSLVAREGGTLLYRASDTQSGAPWALRIIPFSAIAHGPSSLLKEIEKTQALRHKNLVEVEAVGREGDFLFEVTEFVEGQSLRGFIDGKRADGRGVSLKGASNLVAHVSNALEYAQRITRHGALNPAIIWVNRAGRVKVFGLGLGTGVPSLARHGAPEGWPDSLYVAPELLSGSAPTAASDVYSLGIILYELLTGHPPGTPFRSVSAEVTDIPVGVNAVVERALAREPDRRWPSTLALKEALQAAASLGADTARGSGSVARHPDLDERSKSTQTTVQTFSIVAPTAEQAARQPSNSLPLHAHSAPMAEQAVRQTANGSPLRLPLPSPSPSPSQTPVVALGAGADDSEERWLIQKDKLDFGPFSMVQIRAQIERGEILPEHVIVDNDSGARCRVKEYPGLGDLAKTAHRRLEQVRRAQAEQRSEKSEKKKSMATTAIVTLVVASVLGGVILYVLSRRDATGEHLASRQEEAEIESFLKGVKIGGLKATVKRAAHHGVAGGASGGAADDFNNDANFGDASKATPQGDQTLDDDQIQTTMMANYRRLIPCIVHTGVNEIAMEFVVRGTGKVSAVKVNGQRAGTLPGCVLGRMQSFNFPKFDGSKTIASWSMSMGH